MTTESQLESLRATYARIDGWLREWGAIKSDADWARYAGMWEEYVGEPGTVPDAELITHIYLPLSADEAMAERGIQATA